MRSWPSNGVTLRLSKRSREGPVEKLVKLNTMMKQNLAFLAVTAFAVHLHGSEFHVAIDGNDTHRGTKKAPLRTIQRAAELAQPGDVITVHQGIYRERINPPRGGTSDKKRIVYQAARGEQVEIKGSEVIKTWGKVGEDVWKVTLPNSFFGSFNPYSDLIHGDWFERKNRDHHTGAVYLNGDWLTEAATLDEVLMPDSPSWLTEPLVLNPQLWFAQVDATNTTIWAQFKGVNPNEQLVEVNVRQTVFYPDKPGRNFITVRGFRMRHAATPWAPPTAEQIGLIGTHWSKGWTIENNSISHSTCSGIALGKHGDQYDNTSTNTAEGYVKTIERAHAHPIAWTKENIGHHVVRNNTISHCEQAGIVGSLGAAFSTVTGNVIHDIHVRRLFSGAEMGGIKFHAAIDTVIGGNHIYRTCRGLWLDWMAQGTRVSGNLFHENASEDLFVEVDHGPFVVDNNLFLSPTSLLDMSQGGAYAHNLFAGRIVTTEEPTRQTPYHPAHSTTVAGLSAIKGGDNRFLNNIFVGTGGSPGEVSKDDNRHRRVSGYGLWVYDLRGYPLQTGGNISYNHAQAYTRETNHVVVAELDPKVKLTEQRGQFVLHLTLGPELKQARTTLVTTKVLGQARIPGLPYENADGSPLKVSTDYLGKKRSSKQPTPGAFEKPRTGAITLRLKAMP
jgi:alpha-N-arabinofuranosidase